MNRTFKTIATLLFAFALILCGRSIAGTEAHAAEPAPHSAVSAETGNTSDRSARLSFFRSVKRIGKDAAAAIALEDAGLTRDQVWDLDVDLERGFRVSWYEVGFDFGGKEYEYRIDAVSGEILSHHTENAD